MVGRRGKDIHESSTKVTKCVVEGIVVVLESYVLVSTSAEILFFCSTKLIFINGHTYIISSSRLML